MKFLIVVAVIFIASCSNAPTDPGSLVYIKQEARQECRRVKEPECFRWWRAYEHEHQVDLHMYKGYYGMFSFCEAVAKEACR